MTHIYIFSLRSGMKDIIAILNMILELITAQPHLCTCFPLEPSTTRLLVRVVLVMSYSILATKSS
jgi:hypothetical protein